MVEGLILAPLIVRDTGGWLVASCVTGDNPGPLTDWYAFRESTKGVFRNDGGFLRWPSEGDARDAVTAFVASRVES